MAGKVEVVSYRGLKGVVSNDDPLNIDADALADADNFIASKGILKSLSDVAPVGAMLTANRAVGYMQLASGMLIAILKDASYTQFFGVDWSTPVAIPGSPASFLDAATSITNYLGKHYFSSYTNACIYQCDETGAITTISTYCGAAFTYTLGQHLCLANVSKVGAYPTRIAWSPTGQPSVFDPLVNAQAGFNDLGSVAINITGVIPFGTVAYILSPTCITVQNVNGSGTAPFTFTDFTTGEAGIGCIYGGTAAYYGLTGFFVGAENVYMLSLGGQLTAIGGNAWDKIRGNIHTNIGNAPIGSCVPFNDDVLYILATGQILNIYSSKYQAWFFATKNIVFAQAHLFGYHRYFDDNDVVIGASVATNISLKVPAYNILTPDTNDSYVPVYTDAKKLIFRREVNGDTLVTVNRLMVIGTGTVSGTVTGYDRNGVLVSKNFNNIVLQPGLNFISIPPITVYYPQLTITGTGDIEIRRVILKHQAGEGDKI